MILLERGSLELGSWGHRVFNFLLDGTRRAVLLCHRVGPTVPLVHSLTLLPQLFFPKELRFRELALGHIVVSWDWAVLAVGTPEHSGEVYH